MRVAIVGYDVEGQANYRYFSNMVADITIFDEADRPRSEPPVGIPLVCGPTALDQLKQGQFDVVARTAGLSPHKLVGIQNITSSTIEFFKDCPVPIIGVTGTKGKGTVCSLITAILKSAGKTVHLVGNIGKPALNELHTIKEGDVVVYELSSFQLWDVKASPHIAVILKIEPDHLDVHSSMEEYVNAKANIRRYQSFDDVCFYHPSNEYSKQAAHVQSAKALGSTNEDEWRAQAVRYAIKQVDTPMPVVYVEDNHFCVQGRVICPTSALRIPGPHNIENACAAISAALQYMPIENQAVEQGLSSFTGLPHRLKLVKEVKGVRYYDDSIATTPGSAIAALAAFREPKVLILGGSDKGADYSELAKVASASDSIRAIITIGHTGPRIAALFKQAGVQHVTELPYAKTMQMIVEEAARLAKPGDSVILSPASASFDMFKSYADRGEQFVAAVSSLPAQ